MLKYPRKEKKIAKRQKAGVNQECLRRDVNGECRRRRDPESAGNNFFGEFEWKEIEREKNTFILKMRKHIDNILTMQADL